MAWMPAYIAVPNLLNMMSMPAPQYECMNKWNTRYTVLSAELLGILFYEVAIM
jgi:hypothetical protein